LPSIVSTSTQQLFCVNDAISPITFNIGGLATGVSITNGTLPLGLTGSYSSGVFSINGTPTATGTYNYTLTTMGGCSPPATINGTITVSLTSVSGTISGTASVCSGTNSTLLTLSGNIGTIQWQSSTDNITFTDIVNATATTFTATNLTVTTYYKAVVTSGVCTPATTTATITISPISVAGTIAGAATVCSGTNSTLLTLSGNIGTIQWQSSIDNIAFTDIVNATTATNTVTNLSATTYYKALVTIGTCPPATASVTITVNPISVAGTISGAATVCSGTNSTLLTLSGSIGTIQWQSSTDNITFTAIASATTATYTATNLMATTYYKALVTNGVCPPATTSATITVSPTTVAGTISGATTVCAGTNSTVLTISGNTGTIQWQSSTDNITFTYIANATTASYTGTNLTTTTYYKTVVTNGACPPATASATITVNPKPIVTLPQDGYICVDDAGNPNGTYILTTHLSTATNSFLWSNLTGIIAGQSGSSYTAIAPGTYSVTTTNNSTGCTSLPATATISTFLPPIQVMASVTSYFSDIQSVTITVLPIGDYEYKLDFNSFQNSNEFTNLTMGTHEIWVRDKFGCGIKKIVVQIINYPNYFTPNGDSYHDTWNITELKNQPNSYINIFDRYGKLIKQIKPSGPGWDGNYNGNPLPATDYWFTVYYVEQNKTENLSSHFSLLR
jgi:gliding motility-associated-like protein